MTDWSYDPRARRYRRPNGRFLAKATVVQIRDEALAKLGEEARGLAQRAAAGTIDAATFRAEMRGVVKRSHLVQGIFARGGVNAMGPADFGRIGRAVRDAYAYLEGFVAAIERGEFSEAQAMARARLYADAAVTTYERQHAAAWGVSLPVHPGDGGTPCLSNCRCRWDIRETDVAIEATWRTSAGEVCPGCAARARQYSPLVLPRPFAPPAGEAVRLTAVRRMTA